ncbi:MAG TPA: phage holin family protein [Steroidobacteraceae bacterium]|nr:phage holin family protein [Steroidobacteraceae bacterium]
MATESHAFTHPGAAPTAGAVPLRPRTTDGHPPDDTPASALSLLRELFNQLMILVRQELALAGAELNRSLSSLKSGIAALAAAAAVIFSGFLVLLAAAVWALSRVLAGWLAALIVGLGVLAVGAGLLLAARRQLRPAAVTPQRSTESLRRDRDMVARHLS